MAKPGPLATPPDMSSTISLRLAASHCLGTGASRHAVPGSRSPTSAEACWPRSAFLPHFVSVQGLSLRCTAADWMGRLDGHDVPVNRVLNPAQATRTAHVREREMVMELDGERHVPLPVHVNGRRGAALRCLAPALGAHTRE